MHIYLAKFWMKGFFFFQCEVSSDKFDTILDVHNIGADAASYLGAVYTIHKCGC